MITARALEVFRQKAFPGTQQFEYGQKFILNRMESVMLTCAPSQTEGVLNTRIHNDQVILKTLEFMMHTNSHTVLTTDEISTRLDYCLIVFKHYLINRYDRETVSNITVKFPIRTYSTDPYAIPQWLFTIYSIIFLEMNMMFITELYEYFPLFLFDPSYTHIHVIKVYEEANYLVLLSQDNVLHSAFPVSSLYESKELVNTLFKHPTMHDQLDSNLLLKIMNYSKIENVYHAWTSYFHTTTSGWHHEPFDKNTDLNVTSIIDADGLQNMVKDTIKLYRMFNVQCTISSSIIQEYLKKNNIEYETRTFKANARALTALRFKSVDYSFQDLCTFLVFIHRGEMWTRDILRAKIFDPYNKLHERSYLFGVNAKLAHLCTYLKVNIVELKGESIIDYILINSDFRCTYAVIKIEGNLSIVYRIHGQGYIFDCQNEKNPIKYEYDELKKKLDRAKQEDEEKAAADAEQERRKRHIAEVEKKPLNMKKITKANELRSTDEKYSEQYMKEVDDQLFQRQKIREAQRHIRDSKLIQLDADFKMHVPVQYPSSEPKLMRNAQKRTIIPNPVLERKATHSLEKTPRAAKVMVVHKNRVKSDENTYKPRQVAVGERQDKRGFKMHDKDVHKKYKRGFKSTYTDAELKGVLGQFQADHETRVQREVEQRRIEVEQRRIEAEQEAEAKIKRRRMEAEAKAESFREKHRKQAEQRRTEAEQRQEKAKADAERRRMQAAKHRQETVARIVAEQNAATVRKQQKRALREETRKQRKQRQREDGINKRRERSEKQDLQRTLEIAEKQNRSRSRRAILEEKQRKEAESQRQEAENQRKEEEKRHAALWEEEKKRQAELEEKRQAKLEEKRQEDERKRLEKHQAELEEKRPLTSERLMHLYFQIEKETNGFVFLKVPNEFKEFSISFIINLIQYASGQNYVKNINALSKTLQFDAIAQHCPDINIHMLSASGLTKNPSEIKPRPIVVLYKTTRAVAYIVAKRKDHDKIDIFYNPTDEIKQISLPKNKPLLEFPDASEGVPDASEGMFRQTWNNMKKAIRRVFRITATPQASPQAFYLKRRKSSEAYKHLVEGRYTSFPNTVKTDKRAKKEVKQEVKQKAKQESKQEPQAIQSHRVKAPVETPDQSKKESKVSKRAKKKTLFGRIARLFRGSESESPDYEAPVMRKRKTLTPKRITLTPPTSE